ncbi:MAG: BMP family ABC transporter substrate-binding protein [Oscillibacter sp.]|nr:BMP family ABC transporter substrate-binding protein [Oscillibacter sp.]
MVEYYKDARKQAQKEFRACVARGEHPWLPRLDDFVTSEQSIHSMDLGLIQIPMEFVVGTKSGGRTNAFARNFMPLLDGATEFSGKWERLCNTHLKEGIRDPIKATEYMNRYYVEEGNKRVSVLKYFGAETISAYVTRILPPRNGSDESKLYYEFTDFYRYSKINFLEFSRLGSYQRLQRLLGKRPWEAWSDDERNTFKAAYYTFRQVYDQFGGRRLSSTVGDAFLACIRVYGYAALRGITPSEMKTFVEKVWEEITLQQDLSPIDVKLTPEADSAKPLLSTIPAVLPKKILKAAFIHDKTPELSGWTWGHEQGRQRVQRTLHGELESKSYFNAMEPTGPDEPPDKRPLAVIRQAIDDGATVLFTTSPRLLPASLNAAVEFPDVTILNCSVNQSHRYIRTYYARMYEAKFISGAIAGAMAGTEERIGYLCNYPIFGQVAGINAFALGVQMTNPDAEVVLDWSSVGGAKDAIARLTAQGIRIVSCMDTVRRGGEYVGAGLSLIQGGSQTVLAAPVWQWGAYYEALIRRIQDRSLQSEYAGSSKALNYYWGMSAGVVELKLSDALPDSVRKLAVFLRDGICGGTCDPFRGPLYDQKHKRCSADGERLSVERIINMDWLNENVLGSLPTFQQLDDTGKATVGVVGVKASSEFPEEVGTAETSDAAEVSANAETSNAAQASANPKTSNAAQASSAAQAETPEVSAETEASGILSGVAKVKSAVKLSVKEKTSELLSKLPGASDAGKEA